MPYHYQTGEEIRVGDEIITEFRTTSGFRRAIVTDVCSPGSNEAKGWGFPEGGVMIEVDWDGRTNPIFYTSEEGMQEEFTFVKRCAK